MSNAASFFVEGALFCEAWDESMNTRGKVSTFNHLSKGPWTPYEGYTT